MNQNKSIPFIIGSIVIILAAVIVLVQYSSSKNKNPINSSTSQQTTSSDQSYTLAVVATHNSQPSCWTAVNGSVYDVTKWIAQHPGGAQAILSLCGKDGSAAFNNQHGGQRKPENELASFKIGNLTK
jgi:cytochrome b involved in lipid metabolism